MQWTRQRRAREEIAGRFCRERLLKRARRTTLTRTVKSCGPDASTPASSLAKVCRPNRARTGRLSQGDGDKKARSPGRARRKPLKPLRAGMPGDLGGPVVTTLVWLLFFHARLRVHWAPGIPHALFRAELHARPGRNPPRECEGVCLELQRRHCERSEAIHLSSSPHYRLLRCARNDGVKPFTSWLFDN
jgi:hypothetical protein